jgi:hypothetical protein
MSDTQKVLESIKSEALADIKQQLKVLLLSAANDTDKEIRSTGEKITEWLILRVQGKLNDAELEALLYARDQSIRQYKNTQKIELKSRVEKIAVGMVNLVLDKLLGAALGV